MCVCVHGASDLIQVQETVSGMEGSQANTEDSSDGRHSRGPNAERESEGRLRGEPRHLI